MWMKQPKPASVWFSLEGRSKVDIAESCSLFCWRPRYCRKEWSAAERWTTEREFWWRLHCFVTEKSNIYWLDDSWDFARDLDSLKNTTCTIQVWFWVGVSVPRYPAVVYLHVGLTSLSPCRNGSELDDSALADGGVGGLLLHIPIVARRQVTHAGAA